MTDNRSRFETAMRAAIEDARESGDLLTEALVYARFVGALYCDAADDARLDRQLTEAVEFAVENGRRFPVNV